VQGAELSQAGLGVSVSQKRAVSQAGKTALELERGTRAQVGTDPSLGGFPGWGS
jgi:hypothetical protein